MADEIPVVPAAPVASAPVESVAVPAAEPTPAPTPAPIVAPAPAVTPEAPAPNSDAKPAETAAAPTEPAASLLGEAAEPAHEPKPEAAKPEGEKPEGEAKPTAEGDAPAPEEARPQEAPLPTYDVLTVPEGVELEDPQVDRFVGTVAEFERTINPTGDPKVHTAVQGLMQGLLDQYTDEVSQLGARINQVNAETFHRTQENWKEQFFNDPEIGGNRKDTTLRNAGAVIGRFGGTASQVAEVKQVLASTGAGNHIAIIRLVNNIASFLKEPSPIPATTPEPQAMSRTERRYGKK